MPGLQLACSQTARAGPWLAFDSRARNAALSRSMNMVFASSGSSALTLKSPRGMLPASFCL